MKKHSCETCKWWGVDYHSTCDKEEVAGGLKFYVEAYASDDQGLVARLITGKDFLCSHYNGKPE